MFNSEQCECIKSELDLFTLPMLNTSMERGYWTEHLPVSSLNNSGPIEFHITAPDEDYLDIGRTLLYVKASIRNGNDQLVDDDKIGPVNLWMHSLFSQVDVKLNGTMISQPQNTYPYRSYIETLLSYGDDAKQTQLGAQGWFVDTAGKFNDLDPTTTENKGFKSRYQLIRKSPWTEFMGRLHCDIFQQDKYLPNGVDLDVKLIRSSDAFSLIGQAREHANYKVCIESASLYIRRVKINPTIALEHNKILNDGTVAKYPLNRSLVTTFTIPAGTISKSQDNAIQGALPNRILLFMTKNSNFNGEIKSSPYEFPHFKANYIVLYVDGRQVPATPFQPNFPNNEYLRSYMSLFDGINMLHDDRGNGINRDDFPNGFMIHGFDLTPDGSEGNSATPRQSGTVRVEIHFAEALESTINVMLYAEYENTLTIDRVRNVMVDF